MSSYRCTACGNLTRFDVSVSRRLREFHHFSVGGELVIESSDVLDERVERVECRWCGASGQDIEVRAAMLPDAAAGSDAGAA